MLEGLDVSRQELRTQGLTALIKRRPPVLRTPASTSPLPALQEADNGCAKVYRASAPSSR